MKKSLVAVLGIILTVSMLSLPVRADQPFMRAAKDNLNDAMKYLKKATADKGGFIGQASGGSLLLDEIGEMPMELQPKLLRVLQERVYYRVGSEKPQDADFRLISCFVHLFK